jgi:hypothetical protein
MKLTIYWYSQTGQLKETIDAFVAPLVEAGWEIRWCAVTPSVEYPFPWSLRRFLGVMPESADPAATVDVLLPDDDEPDLVLFAYQVWYLAPSVPMWSVLARHPERFAGRGVIGLTACRNMWYSAALAVARAVTSAGGRYLGTVAAIDDAPAGATFVTTLRWMLTGRREAFSIFPRAGVGDRQLTRVRALGEAVAGADGEAGIAQVLARPDAAPVEPAIAAADLAAGRVFRVWSKLARAGKPGPLRGAVLAAFATWLTGTVAVGLPAVVVARGVARRRFDAVVRKAMRPVSPGASPVRRLVAK